MSPLVATGFGATGHLVLVTVQRDVASLLGLAAFGPFADPLATQIFDVHWLSWIGVRGFTLLLPNKQTASLSQTANVRTISLLLDGRK